MDIVANKEPWLLFEPDGTFDGIMWSPKTLDEAQRRFARPRRWATMQREGWTVRRGMNGEHHQLIADRIALQRERNAEATA